MIADVYNPLDEYKAVFGPKFKEVAEKTFARLAEEACIDIRANRETCKQLYDTQGELKSVGKRQKKWKWLRTLLWMVLIGCILTAVALYPDRVALAVSCATAVLSVVLLCKIVAPRLRQMRQAQERLTALENELQKKAWLQMDSLNQLYDWDLLPRMMSETVPRLAFDPYFTQQRLADMQHTYGWNGTFNESRSVLYAHSGLINGNPFVLCRTLRMEMGSKSYTGSKTIYWTTMERGEDGKLHAVEQSETLTATVTAPYPEYFEKTRVIYANKAAPDLNFSRKQSGLAIRERSGDYKRTRRALRKQAENLTGADFAMLSNEAFEVAFDTRNRNNNQQFALLFTPMAQENMLSLLRDRQTGYGDDFDFCKDHMINTIVPAHLQHIDLTLNPARFRHFDFEEAGKLFATTCTESFRAIYFGLAPLLCVPLYQQFRPEEDIYGRDMAPRSAFWEHEALANFWGEDHFKHPECVTRCILKTREQSRPDAPSDIEVQAYGYKKEARMSYIEKWGGDGRMHEVPVAWDEYLPVTGSGHFSIHEDNTTDNPSTSQTDRMAHVREVLSATGCQLYRRHIASRL